MKKPAKFPPYPASWVDRFARWLESLPVSPWLFYLASGLILFGLLAGLEWAQGARPVYLTLRIQFVYAFLGPYMLGIIHYLDRAAATALQQYRPVLGGTQTSFQRLTYELTTMPARPVFWMTLVSAALPLVFLSASARNAQLLGVATGAPTRILALGFLDPLTTALFTLFTYHTVRQLRVVNQTLTSHGRVSLFHMTSFYSLSGLTARTALAILLFGYLTLHSAPFEGFSPASLLPAAQGDLAFPLMSSLIYAALSAIVAAVVFVVPLIGIHSLLVSEKANVQQQVDRRVETILQVIHRGVETGSLRRSNELNRTLSSLLTERDLLAKIPTWPWRPGTLNIVLTAIFLPTVLWLVERLLERLLGA